jgi:rhamnosyltransferase
MKTDATKVVVLMAVKDGLAYLPGQIDSILNQKQCEVSLVISDDCSTDGSVQLIQKHAEENGNIKLLTGTHSGGSAAKNFYRLILESDTTGFDYIAFSDQDDIWLPNKLTRHIQLIREQCADGVSSNVIAFWPDGRERLLDKAQPQRKLDFLFESAGPGCTFLMTPWLIGKVRTQLQDDNNPAKDVVLHDWLIYAICRANGGKWRIDSVPSVKYRQHQTNVVGANVGIFAKLSRLQKLRQHWYRNEVIKVAKVCYKISSDPAIDKLIKLLENKGVFSQLKLLGYLSGFRRKALDQLLLAGAILLGLF